MLKPAWIFVLLVLPAPLGAQTLPPPKTTQVAEGIYLFMTPPYSDVGLDGNAIAIVSRDGVLVFDANGTPAAAAAVLGEIRRLTPQPVRYLVISHWHWDHWYGAEVYREAFPDIQIITHEKTREMMLGPALAFNQPGLDEQLPGHIDAVAAALDEARAKDSASARVERLQHHLQDDQFFLDQKRGVHHTVSNVTFTETLTIYLGEREIRVLHYDRAVTPGDAFLYLPQEKIVVTGDLLVNPISFALGCYPTGWLSTLKGIDTLDATVLIPGHGEPLRDKALLRTNIALLESLLRVGRAAKAEGLGVEQARAVAADSVRGLMLELTHDDPGLNEAFGIYMVDWFLHRVYDELDGRLTDEIAPIPEHPG